MIRYKEKTKDCQLSVKVRLSFGSAVNSQELTLFAQKNISGFLKPRQIKSGVIEYSGPVAVSLFERLAKPVSRYDFFFLIEQIVDATQKLQKNAFSWNKVVWDLHHAYVNETTREVRLLYLPLADTTGAGNVTEFIERMIYSAKPADERDNDFVSRFVYFFKSLPHYDPAKIEDFIAREDRSIVNTIKRHTTGGSGFMTDKPKDYYDHYDRKNRDAQDEEATGLLQDEEATGLLADEGEEATGLLDDGEATGLLRDGDEETGLLTAERTHYPTLYRVLTDECIQVNKPVFRLGKERSYVDYFVTNNNAVSRGHADIITRGDRCFVRDLNSKNRTYINGQAIPPQCECEILDGSRLTLGNEEFIFNT